MSSSDDGRLPFMMALDGLSQRLGHRWALRGVTARVARGELVAITGHNGSGKTTMLRVIATALPPTRGEGSVAGHDLRREPDAVRRVTAFLSHSGGMYGELTAAENLAFMLRMVGARVDHRLMDALDWAGLLPAAHARVRTFSSGMQRRLSLAAVWLRRAPLLLMDEPYNSLDDAGASLIDELLARTAAEGGAAIVALHDRGRGGIAFDRVLELRQGMLACAGVSSTHVPLFATAGAH
jgi:heme exporter protein A